MSKGAVWIAYGNASLREASQAIKKYQAILSTPSSAVPTVALISDKMTLLDNVQHVIREDISWGARQTKVMLDLITPYEQTLYMDADTRVTSNVIQKGFNILEAGWDLVICPSRRQGSDVFGHIDQEERIYTFERLSNRQAMQLQAGVM